MNKHTDQKDCFQKPVVESEEDITALCRAQAGRLLKDARKNFIKAGRLLKEAKRDPAKEMGLNIDIGKGSTFATTYIELRSQLFNVLFLTKIVNEGFGILCEEVDGAWADLKKLFESIEASK
jgi:hypothetical protein